MKKLQDIDLFVKINVNESEKLTEKNVEFRTESRSITSLFVKELGEHKSEDTWRVFISLVKNNEILPLKDMMGVVQVSINFKISDYFKLNRVQKKEKILELIMEGIRKAADFKHWDMQPFLEAERKVKEGDYINQWTWKKKAISPDRKLTAEVYCEHELGYFDAYMIIRNREKEVVKKQKLFRTEPHEFAFGYNFGKLKWKSNQEVELIDKLDKNKWSITINQS